MKACLWLFLLTLIGNSLAGITQRAIHEINRPVVLHLHNEMLAFICLAIDIVYAASQILGISQLLFVLEGNIPDLEFPLEQIV